MRSISRSTAALSLGSTIRGASDPGSRGEISRSSFRCGPPGPPAPAPAASRRRSAPGHPSAVRPCWPGRVAGVGSPHPSAARHPSALRPAGPGLSAIPSWRWSARRSETSGTAAVFPPDRERGEELASSTAVVRRSDASCRPIARSRRCWPPGGPRTAISRVPSRRPGRCRTGVRPGRARSGRSSRARPRRSRSAGVSSRRAGVAVLNTVSALKS